MSIEERRGHGRVAVVTGGASGIGLATATLLAERGDTVVLLDRDVDRLERAVRDLPGRATAVTADVAQPSQLHLAMARIGERHKGIDTLFVNAGIADEPPLLDLSEDAFDRVIGVNLKGALFTFLAALHLLSPGSSAVFTSSVAEGRGRPAGPLYAASKAGVRSLVRTLAVHEDVLARDIRVNAVTPGSVATPLTRQTPEMQAGVEDYVRAAVPLGRSATRGRSPRQWPS